MKYTKRFQTQDDYNTFLTEEIAMVPTLSAINDPVKLEVINFPFYFESDEPIIEKNSGGTSHYQIVYNVKPKVNLYDTLANLLLNGTDANSSDLPEELLSYCTFYVNGNKLDYVGKPYLDFKYGDSINLEFEHTWEPVDGYEFIYAHGVTASMNPDSTFSIMIEVKPLIKFKLYTSTTSSKPNEFQAKDGMTWQEWVNSDYSPHNEEFGNIIKWFLVDNNRIMAQFENTYVYYNDYVKKGDVIVANRTYSLKA